MAVLKLWLFCRTGYFLTWRFCMWRFCKWRFCIHSSNSFSFCLSSSMTFRKRYLKLRLVICASREYIMFHVVILPELLKGGGTFSSILIVPPPWISKAGDNSQGGGGQSPPWNTKWGGTHLILNPLYTLLYIYSYTYFLYKSIHRINLDSWL